MYTNRKMQTRCNPAKAFLFRHLDEDAKDEIDKSLRSRSFPETNEEMLTLTSNSDRKLNRLLANTSKENLKRFEPSAANNENQQY
ncbi:hypothetical protein STSP2_01903 [Anaerohalosphaera lusitana]|uniref:Uncharacterized protein n=1 Tax=Anaerohalosphaera lusitana TaxID=1936003 RepID=A0A1U9NLC5_9BACT|nr:hypothetical protein STSP2_01903 [Anaerohalosphaera lusitana]